MKALLIMLTIAGLAVSCSSNKKSETMKDAKDQAVQAMDGAKDKAAKATEKAMTPSESTVMKMECKLGKDSRGLSVDKNGASGCVVNYTKNGETKQVGKSAVGHTYCKELANRIATNLKNAGFECQ